MVLGSFLTAVVPSSCSSDCAEGQTRCGDECLTPHDLDVDDLNCGSCGNRCIEAELCVQGECICNDTICDGECVDLSLYPDDHCGSCGNTCEEPTPHCDRGQCTACPASDCSGTCTVIDTDPDNCGECGRSCGVGAVCLRGECAYPDAFACEPPCDAHAGWLCCPRPGGSPDQCVHIEDDDNHCGGCGISCAPPGCAGGFCDVY